MSDEKPTTTWLEKNPIPALPWLTVEVLIFAGIVLLAIISRFYNLGERVMSHDESLHTYFSYLYSIGQGYQHNPMMHGPLQFHLIALVYFIFGSSDLTARIPAAIFSVLAVISIWQWRRYLGRTGALIATAMALISPFLLYYGRYTREDPYVGVSLFIMLYSVLRYFETGRAKYIYLISGTLIIHYLTKETSFIYSAELLVYLAVYFIIRVVYKRWEENESDYRAFIVSLIVGLLSAGAAVGVGLATRASAALDAGQTLPPVVPSQAVNPLSSQTATSSPVIVLAIIAVLALAAAIFFLIRGYGMENIRKERSFDLLMLFGTLALPLLSAFAMKALSPLTQAWWGVSVAIPTGEQDLNSLPVPSIILMVSIFAVIVGISIAIGFFWNKKVWWKAAVLFYAIYTVFYTSFFTNGAGFFTGTIGSLGYWLEQQGVQRGSQPWYYYLLIQIPMYEFLPAIACLLALYLSVRQLRRISEDATPEIRQAWENKFNMLCLLAWWTFATFMAFTIAGEKMPWLTFHMVLPMVLWGGWAIGQIIDRVDWADLLQRKALLVVALLIVFTISFVGCILSIQGNPPPFGGKDLLQLQATTTFLFSLLGTLGSAYGLYVLLRGWSLQQFISLNLLVVFTLLAILTTRATIRANYVLYDSGKEYLVYAHGYTGVKDVLRQVMELSNRTTGDDHAIVVGYDNETSWPLSWYMREFPNAKFYGGSPGIDLREVPAIIVGDANFSKIEPIVGDKYYRYDYIRMVWPNQDYFNLTSVRPTPDAAFEDSYSCAGVLSFFQLFKTQDFSRFCSAVSNPEMRQAIFNIWLNRDYKLYGTLTNSKGVAPESWEPSARMRLYIRKDVAQLVWKYGTAPVALEPDIYLADTITLAADLTFGNEGSEPGQFNAPRGIAFAPDGSFYVADSRNHRIQHFGTDNQPIQAWGSFADLASAGSAPAGTFNEPWGIAVGPDGSVYVTDTWNHRIQKFSPDGSSVGMWGSFGQSADKPDALYGPRGIAVDSQGRVFVADTGNKRIVVFDSNGKVLTQFGAEGYDPGQFSEPVDVKLDKQGNVYVTDTWNQRVQVFAPSTDGLLYTPSRQWNITGWKSQSLDNKPYIAIADDGHVFVTDPEGYRVLEFTSDGKFVQTWGAPGEDASSFGLASGIAVDAEGHVWVTDPGNQRVMRFTVPAR